MAFTLKWLTPPWALFWILAFLDTQHKLHENAAPVYLVFFIWLGLAHLIVIAYWIGRAFRRGGNDGQRYSQPPQWQPPR